MAKPLRACRILFSGILVFMASLGAGCAPPGTDKPANTAEASEIAPQSAGATEEPAPTEAQAPPVVKRQIPGVKVPAYVLKTLAYIDKNHRAPSGYEGGRIYHNYGTSGEQTLPRHDARGNKVSYREWDVHAHRLGINRGAERLVTGTDGSAYFTANHYRTFKKIR